MAFRLWKPSWKLAWPVACRLAAPVGGLGGVFQGAIGMSAPVSVTFTNAIQFERKPFIAVMALYFFSMTWMQLPAQLLFDIMTMERFYYSLLATIPMVLGMPLGNWLVRHISRQTFDRAILVLLTVLAVRLLIQALS